MGSRRDRGWSLLPDGRSSSACRAPRDTLSANSNDRGGVASAVAACSSVTLRSVKAFPRHVPDAPAVDPPMNGQHYQLANVADSCAGWDQRTKTGPRQSPRRFGSRLTCSVSVLDKRGRSDLVSDGWVGPVGSRSGTVCACVSFRLIPAPPWLR